MSQSPLGHAPFLYPIIDSTACAAAGLDSAAVADACLAAGARLLQLRCKGLSSGEFLSLAERVVRSARGYGAAVIINDRPDIARLAGADGVHVGQDDLAIDAVLAVVGADTIVGVSTHDERQIDLALDGPATYVAVGPVFGTRTKETGYSARGLELVRYAAGRGKPIVAIGGITLERVASVIAAGASGVAIISDLLAGDPEQRARQMIAELARRL
jgi:thiamine-phosphate pyrophosphorylase